MFASSACAFRLPVFGGINNPFPPAIKTRLDGGCRRDFVAPRVATADSVLHELGCSRHSTRVVLGAANEAIVFDPARNAETSVRRCFCAVDESPAFEVNR